MSDAALLPAPTLYPHQYDTAHDSILFVAMAEADYRQASFLDERVLKPGTRGGWMPAAEAEQKMRGFREPRPLHFIFHTGHVGSTLLSRLIEEAPGVLGLREPLPLRTLAQMQDSGAGILDTRLALFANLWRRGFAQTHSVVIKATSSGGRLAPRLLNAEPQARAVYLNLRAEPYLATLLAGANAIADLQGFEDERRGRLEAMLGAPLPPVLSVGPLAAMSWLAESLTRSETLAQFPERVLPVDFDGMLNDLSGTIDRVLAHLRIVAPPGLTRNIARSPMMTRYSKAPEQYSYTPALRLELLEQARKMFSGEITMGLRYLDTIARNDARVAALL